jgi:SPP1 gp7 family putative phage head morphogenesis protein
LLRYSWDNRDALFSWELFDYTTKVLVDSLVKGFKNKSNSNLILADDGMFDIADIGIDYNTPDRLTAQLMEANIFKFSASKSLAIINKLNDIVTNTNSFSEFKTTALNDGIIKQFNASYLQTEYNYTWSVSQNAANYHRMIAIKDTYPTWVYQTVGDDRVRDAHRALDGKMFKADDPAFNSLHPPLGYGCRCYIKPTTEVPEKYSNTTDAINALGKAKYDEIKSGGFGKNSAKTNVVFDEGKMYIKNTLEQSMGIKDNGVKTYPVINDNAPIQLFAKRTTDFVLNWYKANVLNNTITDYAGRAFSFTKETLDHHLTDKYIAEGRQDIVEYIPQILNNPDEMWFWKDNRNGKLFYKYIKFYKDKPIMVIAELKDDAMQIDSWYELRPDEIDMHKRTGILIKAKTFNH